MCRSIEIKRLGPAECEVAGPGLVDLQVNGYAGVDFNSDDGLSAEGLDHAGDAMRRRGVLAALATIISAPRERLIHRLTRLDELLPRTRVARELFVGIHLEGPFISARDGPRGAHPREGVLAPADRPELWPMLQAAAGGRIRLLTLAPELPGALALIARVAGEGVVPAIGHTQADRPTLTEAVRAGARLSTHLGNGSGPVLPRLDNYIHTQLACDRLQASFIADGIHMPLTTLQSFLRAKGARRSILVTDATAGADAEPGEYTLGAQPIVRSDGGVVVGANGGLAGSALTLDRAIFNVWRHCGQSLSAAWAMASTAPARLIGLDVPPPIRGTLSEAGLAGVTFQDAALSKTHGGGAPK